MTDFGNNNELHPDHRRNYYSSNNTEQAEADRQRHIQAVVPYPNTPCRHMAQVLPPPLNSVNLQLRFSSQPSIMLKVSPERYNENISPPSTHLRQICGLPFQSSALSLFPPASVPYHRTLSYFCSAYPTGRRSKRRRGTQSTGHRYKRIQATPARKRPTPTQRYRYTNANTHLR